MHIGFTTNEIQEYERIQRELAALKQQQITYLGDCGALAARCLARNGKDFVYWITGKPLVIRLDEATYNLTFVTPENAESLTSPAAELTPTPTPPTPALARPLALVPPPAPLAQTKKPYNQYNWPSDDVLRELAAKHPPSVIGRMLSIPGGVVSNRLTAHGLRSVRWPRRGQIHEGGMAAAETMEDDDEVLVSPKPPSIGPVVIGQMSKVQDQIPPVHVRDFTGDVVHAWRNGTWSCRVLLCGDSAVLSADLPDGRTKASAFDVQEFIEGVTAVRSSSQSDEMYAEFASDSGRPRSGTVKLVAQVDSAQHAIRVECYSAGQRWSFNLNRKDLFIAAGALTKRCRKVS